MMKCGSHRDWLIRFGGHYQQRLGTDQFHMQKEFFVCEIKHSNPEHPPSRNVGFYLESAVDNGARPPF